MLGLGAGAMYWLDPATGRRRRARLGQQAMHGAREVSGGASRAARDLTHRGEGALHWASTIWRPRAAPDEVVVERVRARLGRVIAHPAGVEVSSHEGVVQLRGAIRRAELKRVLGAVGGVRGVRRVENALELRDDDRRGGAPRPAAPGAPSPGTTAAVAADERALAVHDGAERWSPARRLLGVATGVGMVMKGVRRGGIFGLGSTATGVGMILRSLFNRPWGRIVGWRRSGATIDVRKTINVNAPIEQVFSFLAACETFPRFMSHVREVTRIGERRYHWKVQGPGGTAFSWDAEVTRLVPKRLLVWRSLPGASVDSAGVIRFEPAAGGKATKVDVRLTYRPPGGMLGHGVARLLGADPKQEMNDDLLRFKSLIELGRATGHVERVTREEIARDLARLRPLKAT
jgi:uncharacterized membrane protein